MSISIEDLNKQISVVNLDIKKNDYDEKVKSILNDYRKKANIPGFRKGFVQIGLIKKQYEIPVKVDEINKIVQSKLTQFISEKKLSLLGTPVPIDNEKIKVKILCYPRIFGYVFNPLSVFYVYNNNNDLISVLYEVKNTFGEQHTYVFKVKNDNLLQHNCEKKFHVSPFIEMNCSYFFSGFVLEKSNCIVSSCCCYWLC